MENITDIFPANETFPKEKVLPRELSEISENSYICMFTYCLLFLVATTGNVIIFRSLLKGHRSKHSRFSLLLLHLTMADLIVCFTVIPTEVFWRITIQWRGGWQLCKLTQFSRAFGLYLSSLVLICVSVDRCCAIVFPLQSFKVEAYSRTKVMLITAWMSAALFSLPQAVFFSVEAHPEFPTFKQCVTKSFLNSYHDLEMYTILSLTIMYFLPLVVVLFTYTAILVKIVRKSRSRLGSEVVYSGNSYRNSSPSSSANVSFFQGYDIVRINSTEACRNNRPTTSLVRLRSTTNAGVKLSKAVSRTILVTVIIVTSFVVCWTPYAVMVLWYMIDWKGAEKVDPLIQEALFLMAVANSCINPLINGSFTYKNKKDAHHTRV